MGRGAAQTETLLGFPHGIGIFVLRDIVQVAIVILDPTAENAEGISVHGLGGLFLPLLAIAYGVTEALGIVEINAECDFLLVLDNGQRLTVLQAGELGGTQLEVVGQYLEVVADDRSGDSEHLAGVGVELHECLDITSVTGGRRADDGLALTEQGLLGIGEHIECETGLAGIEHDLDIAAFLVTEQGETGTVIDLGTVIARVTDR